MVTLRSPWPSWLLSGPNRFDAIFIGWITPLAVQESSRATIPINPTLTDVESLGVFLWFWLVSEEEATPQSQPDSMVLEGRPKVRAFMHSLFQNKCSGRGKAALRDNISERQQALQGCAESEEPRVLRNHNTTTIRQGLGRRYRGGFIRELRPALLWGENGCSWGEKDLGLPAGSSRKS